MKLSFNTAAPESEPVNEAISRSLETAESYSGELSICVMSLSQIELDPLNKRSMALTLEDAKNGINKNDPDFEIKKKNWASLESLAKTIAHNKVLNPISVYRFGNKCRLIAGERRSLASAIAGKDTIIARIFPERPKGTNLRVLQWIENHERSDLSLSEKYESLELMVDEYCKERNINDDQYKIPTKALSELTGMATTQARRYNLMLSARQNVKDAIKKGLLENIKIVEAICSTADLNQQDILLKAAISGVKLDVVEKLKKESNDNSSKKTDKRKQRKTNVSLGKAKPNVVKLIVDALTSSSVLSKDLVDKINIICGNLKWHNGDAAQKSFKKIMLLLDEEVK
jgi:ParB family transcriptional regulator, chromosome partitioning protein